MSSSFPCDCRNELDDDDVSALMDALQVCYSTHVGHETDHVTLALATNIADTLAAFYDCLVVGQPRGVLPGARLNEILGVLQLPSIDPDDTPRFCSVNDFQRTICRQYCSKHSIEYRPPGRLTLTQIFDAIRDDAIQRATADSLVTLCENAETLMQHHDPVSRAVIENVTVENLVRTVCRQQAEIAQLRQFSSDVCSEVKRIEMKYLNSVVEQKRFREEMEKLRQEQQQSRPRTPVQQSAQSQEAITALKRLRHTLLDMKPIVHNMEQRIVANKRDKPIGAEQAHAAAVKATMPEKSVAEDSGWVSDEDEEAVSEMMTTSISSDTGVKNDVPDLPFDMPSTSKAPPRTIYPEEVTKPVSYSAVAQQQALKLRLSTLARKLKDAECKLTCFLQEDEHSLVD